MSAEILLELNGVDVQQEDGSAVVLQDVNWRVARGEFWVVSGAPDIGKAALLATAAALQRPAAGTSCIFGRDAAEATEAEQIEWRRRIGFVFRNGGRLFSHLSIAENVALPLRYHTNLDEMEVAGQVDRSLERAELAAFADAMPSGLSPRLQQRASLIRAWIVPTELLILENPLGGLGTREAHWWLEYLRELRAQQTAQGNPLTIVASSDDFQGWLDLADHFGLIQHGQFRALGDREQLLANKDAAVLEFVRTLGR